MIKCAGAAALAALLAISAGCGSPGEPLTAHHSGRRVGEFDVDGEYLAYEWTPAQLMSTQGHLVLANLTTGEERELVSDLQGPLALSAGRLAWWNSKERDEENESDLILYDCRRGERAVAAHERVGGLDLDGAHLVYSRRYPRGEDVVLRDLETGESRVISSGGEAGTHRNEEPTAGGGYAAWLSYEYSTREYTLEIENLETGEESRVPLGRHRTRMSLSPPYLAYTRQTEAGTEIRLYNVETGADSLAATRGRFTAGPYVEGDLLAWSEHITAEEYDRRPIPGQPLMDERDVREIFLHRISNGKTEKISDALIASGGRVEIHGGRVYMNVYRDPPPPRRSNLVVDVDLRVW